MFSLKYADVDQSEKLRPTIETQFVISTLNTSMHMFIIMYSYSNISDQFILSTDMLKIVF